MIVVSKTLNLRQKPTTSSATLKKLRLGTVLGVLGKDGNWLYVYDAESDRKGYVHSSYVSRYERRSTAQWEGVCNSQNAVLREGPSTYFDRTGTLARGSKVYVYYQSGNWYFVMDRATGRGAFVYKSAITLGNKAPSVLRGDADGSGEVTELDAERVLQYVVSLSWLDGKAQLAGKLYSPRAPQTADSSSVLSGVTA